MYYLFKFIILGTLLFCISLVSYGQFNPNNIGNSSDLLPRLKHRLLESDTGRISVPSTEWLARTSRKYTAADSTGLKKFVTKQSKTSTDSIIHRISLDSIGLNKIAFSDSMDFVTNNKNIKHVQKLTNDSLSISGLQTELPFDSITRLIDKPFTKTIFKDSSRAGFSKQAISEHFNSNKMIDSSLMDKLPFDKSITKQLNQTALPKLDSAALKNKGKTFVDEQSEKYTGHTLSSIELDSAAVKEQLVNNVENYATQQLKKQDAFKGLTETQKFEVLKAEKESISSRLNNLSELDISSDLIKIQKENIALKSKAFLKKHQTKINNQQNEIRTLKHKYKNVQSTKEMTGFIKHTSLKNEPFLKRFVPGGGFSLIGLDPFRFKSSLLLGWKINTKLESGFTGIFQTTYIGRLNNLTHKKDQSVYGYSVYTNYNFYKGFIVSLELENVNSKINIPNNEALRKWRQSVLVGIGKNFRLKNWLALQTIALVNIRNLKSQPNYFSAPIVLKTNFRLSFK